MSDDNKTQPIRKWWRVPMRLHFRDAEALVLAETAEEAESKASEGNWNSIPVEGECVDFYVTGEAKENV